MNFDPFGLTRQGRVRTFMDLTSDSVDGDPPPERATFKKKERCK